MTPKTPSKITDIEYEFIDKSGRLITFKFLEDIEGPNRGFTVDRLDAYFEDEKVGHLRTIYQDADKIDKFFPSGVLNFIDQCVGMSLFKNDSILSDNATNIKNCDVDTLNSIANRLISNRYFYDEPETPFKDYADFDKWFNETEQTRLLKKHFSNYEKMLLQVGHHTVDFVETIPNIQKTNDIINNNNNLGIGTILYKILGKELAKKGHTLHSGFYQAPSAETIWNKLQNEGYTKESDIFILKYATKDEPAVMRQCMNPDAYELEYDTPKLNM